MQALVPKRVLVYSKLTRLEGESRRLNLDLNSHALDSELSLRGFHVASLRSSHEAHVKTLNGVIEALLRSGASTRMVQARSGALGKEKFVDEDMVISVGGDGTALECLRQNIPREVPFLGVNSDPIRSTGMLCTYAFKEGKKFDDVLSRLGEGRYSVLMRQRVGVTVSNADGVSLLPVAALNEVFFGEREPTVPTKHETTVVGELRASPLWCFPSLSSSPNHLSSDSSPLLESDDDDAAPTTTIIPHKKSLLKNNITSSSSSGEETDVTSSHSSRTITQRSCGVIVCSGSGSTAWIRSATAIHAQDVRRVAIASSLGGNNEKLTSPLGIKQICARLNEACVFHPDSRYVGYVVREPLLGYTGAESKVSDEPKHGLAHKVVLRNLGYDVCVTVDGLSKIPLSYGDVVECSIDPLRSLMCVIPHEGGGLERRFSV